MKKFWKPLILAALTALCVAPAHALEYVAPSSVSLASAYGESSLTTLGLLSPQSLGGGFAGAPQYNIDGAEDYLFGRPTSDNTIYEWENPNVDRSKNTALIPPGFGTPTSYLPGSGEYLTPNLVPGALSGGLVNQVGSVGNPNGGTSTNTMGSGYPTADTSVDSSGFPTVDTGVSGTGGQATAFTEVTSSMYYSNGSLGTLKIPSIGLTVGVYEGTGSAPLLKGAGHFEGTSIWNGNIAIAGHNRGVRNDFGKIHTLKSGDTITLTTALGTRTYAVTSVSKVSVNDTSGLSASIDNQITLYTCVENQPAYRWCVRAQET